jgi:hypothetical protein
VQSFNPAVDPDGEYRVWTFRIDGSGPARLTGPPQATPWAGQAPPSLPLVEPSGRFAYRTHERMLEGYAIDSTTAALSPLPRAPEALGAPAEGMVMVSMP